MLGVDSVVYLGVDLGEKGGFRGSPPKKRKKSVGLGVDLGADLGVYLGVYQAFHYWEVPRPVHIKGCVVLLDLEKTIKVIASKHAISLYNIITTPYP